MSGIVGNRHTLILAFFRNNKIRQSLGCLTYRINIQTVCSGANDATEPSGSKFQIFIKPILNFFLISRNLP